MDPAGPVAAILGKFKASEPDKMGGLGGNMGVPTDKMTEGGVENVYPTLWWSGILFFFRSKPTSSEGEPVDEPVEGGAGVCSLVAAVMAAASLVLADTGCLEGLLFCDILIGIMTWMNPARKPDPIGPS